MFTKSDITGDLKRLGLVRGDSVVVHSSYKKIGTVDGGPHAVVEALAGVVLPGGALLFPNLNIPHEFTTANPPRFDLQKDHIKNLGILPEIFKFQYARYFSIHPTHALTGIGEKAPELLSGHEKAGGPCGRGTPWEKNAKAGGKILLIGVDGWSNTTGHCAEEQIADPYILSKDIINGTVILDGRELTVPSRLHIWGFHSNFNMLHADLQGRGSLRAGKIGSADSRCIDAGALVSLALERLQGNPKFFRDKKPRTT